jgi:hypothetical protein
MDFRSFQWAKAKDLDGDVAEEIRHDVRRYRREKGRGGHRFRHATLKNLWHVENIHAVLNHADDPVWQYWYNHASNGWQLVGYYFTRREAQAAAERPHPIAPIKPLAPGRYIFAAWPDHEVTMRVRISSDYTGEQVSKVFGDLGCQTSIEEFAGSESG